MAAALSRGHRILRWVFAFAAGLVLALYAFERISDPQPRLQRAREEAAVLEARAWLQNYVVAPDGIELVDPLKTNRRVGKVYVYPTADGWEVSGYYRRDKSDAWHPWLMRMDPQLQLVTLAVRDADLRLTGLAAEDPRFSVQP